MSWVDLLKQFRLSLLGGMVHYNNCVRQNMILTGRPANTAKLQIRLQSKRNCAVWRGFASYATIFILINLVIVKLSNGCTEGCYPILLLYMFDIFHNKNFKVIVSNVVIE